MEFLYRLDVMARVPQHSRYHRRDPVIGFWLSSENPNVVEVSREILENFDEIKGKLIKRLPTSSKKEKTYISFGDERIEVKNKKDGYIYTNHGVIPESLVLSLYEITMS